MNAVVPTDQPGLIDQFGRRIDYVRLSVTDRCDLRCSYCMPEGFKGFEEPEHWLNFDEIERLIGAFARLGVRRIRLTGGEPLLRRNIAELAGRIPPAVLRRRQRTSRTLVLVIADARGRCEPEALGAALRRQLGMAE